MQINMTGRFDTSIHLFQTHTKLTQVQAEVGSLHQAGVLTHGPNVEVHEDRQAGERCHSEPHQEEQVGQEHELQRNK